MSLVSSDGQSVVMHVARQRGSGADVNAVGQPGVVVDGRVGVHDRPALDDRTGIHDGARADERTRADLGEGGQGPPAEGQQGARRQQDDRCQHGEASHGHQGEDAVHGRIAAGPSGAYLSSFADSPPLEQPRHGRLR